MHALKSVSGTAGVLTLMVFAAGLLSACDVVPGSEAWCDKMAKKDKTSWSMEDAKTYAEECVIDPAKEDLKDMKDDISQ